MNEDSCSGSKSALNMILGESPAMRAFRSDVRAIGRMSDETVGIGGESGTGKALAAEALHEASGRTGPLVIQNCGELHDPEAAMSALFGHTSGAFTGAVSNRNGAFASAAGGTLVLDEIGELNHSLQPALLHVLENKAVKARGSDREVPCDFRLIYSTHRSLEAMVRDGTLRLDLFFRLDRHRLVVPPLRERLSDIPLLVAPILACAGDIVPTLSEGALTKLFGHAWPGNVRELHNVIHRALLLANGAPLIRAEHIVLREIPLPREHQIDPNDPDHLGVRGLTLERLKLEAAKNAVQRHLGNHAAAARELEIAVSTLSRILAGCDHHNPPPTRK